MGRAPVPSHLFILLEMASTTCFFPQPYPTGKKEVHQDFGWNWKAQEISHYNTNCQYAIY